METSRRTLLRLGPAAALYWLATRNALAKPLQAKVFEGLREMSVLASELRHGALRPETWQDEMARLVAPLDVHEAMQAIDLDALIPELDPLPSDRPRVKELGFSDLDDALREAGLHIRLFALARGRAIVPHGHHGLVSMHWLLRGSLHGRHYDRLSQTRTHVIMRPTLDEVLRPGAATSVSDQRDNIHWFVALDAPAFTLDTVLSHLNPEGPSGRFYLDPNAAEPGQGDQLRTPIISPADARHRYGSR